MKFIILPKNNLKIKTTYFTTKMKKLATFLILSTMLFSTSCGQKESNTEASTEQEINTAISSDFTKYFEGTIDDKYGITMTLNKSAKNLSGTYSYKSQRKPMKISGTTDDNDFFILNEFNEKGNMTGVFKGKYSDGLIIGEWSKPDGIKTMPFSIKETTINDISITEKESKKLDDNSNWTGTYIDEYDRTLKIIGPASDGAVKFELTPQNSESCQEDVWKGTAYLTKSYVANYSNRNGDCHLNLTFNPGQIEVREYDCGHGACSPFDGFYTKVK